MVPFWSVCIILMINVERFEFGYNKFLSLNRFLLLRSMVKYITKKRSEIYPDRVHRSGFIVIMGGPLFEMKLIFK